jgi:1-deoxy-D-xylulose-5-phosphate reductoisomerase
MRFDAITPQDALQHPNWSMGNKVSIDSATLMNKGLEVIEARWLFNVEFRPHQGRGSPPEHRSLDGRLCRRCGDRPDGHSGYERAAIAYGLSHPRRLPLDVPAPDFARIGQLTFEEPDLERFPCLALAYQAGEQGGALPAVLNAANEVGRSCVFGRPAAVYGDLSNHRPDPEPPSAEQMAPTSARSSRPTVGPETSPIR